jgi:hypothetical protein
MIPAEPEQLKIANDLFPQSTGQGLRDYSCNIHSFGCSYWTALGLQSGYSSICEQPAPNVGIAALKGENIISDSAWFQKTKDHPDVLVEFERYSDENDASKLMGKLHNLLLGYWRWSEQPRILILAYWTKGLRNLPDHRSMKNVIRNGFMTSAREPVPGSSKVEIRFYQFVFEPQVTELWRLVHIKERGTE